ncbi:MAG: electron transport complex subunit RsxE [Oscillospiraceae bacterium]
MKKIKLVTNGLFNENPVLRLVLGTCPTLAISTTVLGGVGMGLAATFVLICSNMVISALRKLIPDKVRIPAYITVIAGFVTIIQMVVQAFLPALYDMLGIYLPLIVVNCIILGRAEMFASKNPVIDSGLDGLGMGLGFTLTLLCMGSIREIIGNGSWFGIRLFPQQYAISILTMPPGGFFMFGVIMAALIALLAKKGVKLNMSQNKCIGCDVCDGCKEAKQ